MKKKKTKKNKIFKDVKKFRTVDDGGKKFVLHLGCGRKGKTAPLNKRFTGSEWVEVRLDHNTESKPDIVSSTFSLGKIADEQFDAIWAPHTLQLLYAHQVVEAFNEYYRILKPGGFLMLITNDLMTIAEEAAKKGVETPLYKSPAGPVCAIDMIYGFRPLIASGLVSAACKTGFSANSLGQKIRLAGFQKITIKRDKYSLIAAGYKFKEKVKDDKVKIIEENINEIMRKRDEIDAEPEIWLGFPPKE